MCKPCCAVILNIEFIIIIIFWRIMVMSYIPFKIKESFQKKKKINKKNGHLSHVN